MLPSAANFVFAATRKHDAAQLAAAPRERAIIVRHKHPRIDQFCASRSAERQTDVFVWPALAEILAV